MKKLQTSVVHKYSIKAPLLFGYLWNNSFVYIPVISNSKIYAAIAMANGKRTPPFVHIVIDKITKIINMILLKKDKKFPIAYHLFSYVLSFL